MQTNLISHLEGTFYKGCDNCLSERRSQLGFAVSDEDKRKESTLTCFVFNPHVYPLGRLNIFAFIFCETVSAETPCYIFDLLA